ncbi:MAG: MBOAT family protein [Bacteroidales bacterium]|jgi:alginate O-acetyltransferase complex protein AlgI|nr:MBOAT family protein [Bacteroidales bacterium]
MVFSSALFVLFFLPIFLLTYSLMPKRARNYTLLVFSIIFYAYGAPKFVFVLLATTIINFYLVSAMDKSKNKSLLVGSVILNLGLLFVFKYFNFFIDTTASLIHLFGGTMPHIMRIALPIGISFFVFQSITYTIDVWRGTHARLKRLSDYIIYIIAFPQMIAGPIVRFGTIADELICRNESFDNKLIGFYKFSIGLAKKVLIANAMAAQANYIFSTDFETLGAASAWLGILAYTFQIYFDFSGYSDMAIGLGQMMGFHFPENFRNPYISTSITDFWKRWHMSLSSFIKDYLYIPLGGNRVKTKRRLYFNLGLCFLLSGLWHGAAWNFILWGAFHGLFLILDRVVLLRLLQRLWRPISVLLTFIVVMFGWLIFVIEDMGKLKTYFLNMFDFSADSDILTKPIFFPMLILAVLFSVLPYWNFGKKIQNFFFYKETYKTWQHLILFLCFVLLLIVSISHIIASDYNPFIYFRF